MLDACLTEGPSPPLVEVMALRDESLLCLLAAGSQSALSILYDRHSPLVFGLALHITADQQLAEDVTVEVFVRVWQCHRSFRPATETVQSWIITLAWACIRDGRQGDPTPAHYRHSSRASRARDGAAWATTAEHQLDPRATLGDALRSLPTSQREVLELACYSGLTAREIAAISAAPVGTITSRVRGACTTLRAALETAAQQTPAGASAPQTGAAGPHDLSVDAGEAVPRAPAPGTEL